MYLMTISLKFRVQTAENLYKKHTVNVHNVGSIPALDIIKYYVEIKMLDKYVL